MNLAMVPKFTTHFSPMTLGKFAITPVFVHGEPNAGRRQGAHHHVLGLKN
jgi:hypothetical protein